LLKEYHLMRDPSRSGNEFSLGGLLNTAQLAYRLYSDDRVPTLLKVAIPLAVAIYFLSPIDLIPDFIPGLGQLDDIGVILIGMSLFVKLAPQQVANEHRRALGLPEDPPADADATTRLGSRPRPGAVVDAPYTVVDDETP
jgi:uncharacterized membrane protein YkvA (DUF1232 family)